MVEQIVGATIDARMLRCHVALPDDTPAREGRRTKRGALDLLSLVVQEIFSKECQTCLILLANSNYAKLSQIFLSSVAELPDRACPS